MNLFLFLLVNATLFIRPGELIPALQGLPIYNALVLLSLLLAAGQVLSQCSTESLRKNPLTVCVFGVFLTIVFSQLARFDTTRAMEFGGEFFKVTLYYLLMLAVVNTPARLQKFLTALAVFSVLLAGLSLAHFHEFVSIPALESLERAEIDAVTGEESVVMQLRSTGIYNDPNDFCLILVMGLLISLHQFAKTPFRLSQVVWTAPMSVCLYALILTRSRGGLLGLMAGIFVMLACRFGMKKALLPLVVLIPGLILMTGGRQAQLSTSTDTAQERIHLWDDGLYLLVRSPISGIGVGNYAEEMGLVAHNSFVHSFTELGVIGGICFLGAFFLSLDSLRRLGSSKVAILDPDLKQLRPLIMAIVAGYSVGLISISRCYIVPTFMVVGIAAVYLRVVRVSPSTAIPTLNPRLIARTCGVGMLFLIFIFAFIHMTILRD